MTTTRSALHNAIAVTSPGMPHTRSPTHPKRRGQLRWRIPRSISELGRLQHASGGTPRPRRWLIRTLKTVTPIEPGSPHSIFEARQRLLRAQGRPLRGIVLEQEPVDRFVGQPGRVVAIGSAQASPNTRWRSRSQSGCATLRGCRRSRSALARRQVGPGRSSTTFRGRASPSELACG
jgi:hypothetical protein